MDTAGDERDGRGAAGRRGDGRERVCRLGRQWLERWGRRWRGPCGLSGLESSRAGLWWYTSELQRCAGHRERGRLERWRPGWGQRRRGEPGVCTAGLAERTFRRSPGAERSSGHARRARRGRQCRSANGLPGARRRHGSGHRGHQRRGPLVGSADCKDRPLQRPRGGLVESAAVRLARSPARHYPGQQRRLSGEGGLGWLHRPRQSQRRETGQPVARVKTDIPARLDRLPWSRFHLLMIVALGITWILDGLEVTIVGSIGPALQSAATLSLSASELGAAGSAYVIGAVGGALLSGWVTDRYGRRRVFYLTLCVYLVGVAATALSWNFWSFALFRALTGAGIGGEYSAVNSAIDELIPARYRGRIDLMVNGSFWFGAAAGAAVSLVILNPHWL